METRNAAAPRLLTHFTRVSTFLSCLNSEVEHPSSLFPVYPYPSPSPSPSSRLSREFPLISHTAKIIDDAQFPQVLGSLVLVFVCNCLSPLPAPPSFLSPAHSLRPTTTTVTSPPSVYPTSKQQVGRRMARRTICDEICGRFRSIDKG